MSALLTTTMPYMKVVIEAMKAKGIRNDHIVLVGGAPLNEAFAEADRRRRLLPRRVRRGRNRQGRCWRAGRGPRRRRAGGAGRDTEAVARGTPFSP